jgi:acylphosphatase
VQGVFYRASCAREAERAGVAGWVKNLPDGRVEAVFEGDPDQVAKMIDWCRRGPAGAHVTAVDVAEEPPTGERGFRVAR